MTSKPEDTDLIAAARSIAARAEEKMIDPPALADRDRRTRDEGMSATVNEYPTYGQLVIADWPDASRPAWYDHRLGWVRIDTELVRPGGADFAYMPRITWDRPAPLSWAPIARAGAGEPPSVINIPIEDEADSLDAAMKAVSKRLDDNDVPEDDRAGAVGQPFHRDHAPGHAIHFNGVPWTYYPMLPADIVVAWHQHAVVPPATVLQPKGIAYCRIRPKQEASDSEENRTSS